MKLKTVSLFLLAVFSPLMMFGLGIRLPDQDAFATARGEAFVATADNPSAIYYNPAGITQLPGVNLRAGFYGIYLDSHYTAAGSSIHTKDSVQGVPQLFFTYSLTNLPISFGLGLYAPYGLAVEWPASAPFSPLGDKGSLDYLTLNPVIAWQVLTNLSIAAGPTINYGDIYLNQTAPLAGPNANFFFHGNDVAPGFNAGILWQPCSKIYLGASYRSESSMNFGGHANLTGTPGGSFSSASSLNLPFPQNIVGGISYRPTPDWNIEFDADWTDWHRLRTLTVSPTPVGPQNLAFNWQSSFFYEFGVTRYLDHGWRVSGGYIYSENSVPDATFNPVVPDSDRHIWSLGVGRTYKKFSWDATYQLAWGPSRTINSATIPEALANGNYEYLSHALSVSVGYHF
jgi:long-chain fatty acid transport protein